ncbi:helix-turn-helix domain-containing protein [Ningiella sp. W23]|uniref:helix-turn-helix domain-containing protein n=1 Tax=Ningiella sp. W23 TaxID=3023715 RepID=UPI003756A89F
MTTVEDKTRSTYCANINKAYGLADHQIKKVRDYVNAHLDEDISIDDLAEQVFLSKFHFARLFKLKTGNSPYQFILNLRLQRSLHLLCDTKSDMTEIALASGFSSQSHYCDVFRRKLGTTPGKFRSLRNTHQLA